MKKTLTYFLSKSSHPDMAIDLTVQGAHEGREICNMWPNESHLNEAIGAAVVRALQSKNDYGNNVRLVIELEVCSIIDPMIKF
jgi:hypothetical protein